ncbi:MAG: hypothetical protein N2507_01270 [Candidatus Bipolaricaulota bacterium]|nr:hypothetical protein [Candidatus Bipolaricaulota bacterium]
MQEFTFLLGNRPGALLAAAAAPAEEQANLVAIAAPTVLEEAAVSLVTGAPDKTREVLRRLGVDYEERGARSLSLSYRPGPLAAVLDRLARGGIDVLSRCFAAEKTVLVFAVDDLARAKAILRPT